VFVNLSRHFVEALVSSLVIDNIVRTTLSTDNTLVLLFGVTRSCLLSLVDDGHTLKGLLQLVSVAYPTSIHCCAFHFLMMKHFILSQTQCYFSWQCWTMMIIYMRLSKHSSQQTKGQKPHCTVTVYNIIGIIVNILCFMLKTCTHKTKNKFKILNRCRCVFVVVVLTITWYMKSSSSSSALVINKKLQNKKFLKI
jgi:hypothetical protein